MQFVASNEPGSVRLVPIAEQNGISGERASQYGRTWDNDGLVRAIGQGGRLVTLTSFGRRFTFEGSYSDIE